MEIKRDSYLEWDNDFEVATDLYRLCNTNIYEKNAKQKMDLQKEDAEVYRTGNIWLMGMRMI